MKPMTRVVLLGCVLVVAGLLSHVGPALAQEAPEVTARDVVDRDTLKAFVQGAIAWLAAQFESGEPVDINALKELFRMDPGPWKHGSTYFVVLVNNRVNEDLIFVFFDAGNPDRDNKALVALNDDVKKVMKELAAVAVENAPDDGGFVEHEEAGMSRVSYAQLVVGPPNAGVIANQELVISAGFNPGDSPIEMDVMTTFVPVVLDSSGRNNSHFTSELALTNRGSEAAMLNFTYTAHAGG
ncbi:MAG: hypothetical protein OXG96_10825, partial [Acidobacteria bacterium]|nr:hypothetical protein [Acidobacteriota bacterium]